MVCFLLESPLAAAVGAMLYTKLFFIFMISACQCAAVVRSWIEPHREGDSGRIRYTCRPSSQSVVHPTLTYPTSLNFMRNDFFPLSRAPQLIFDFSGHPCVNPDPRNRRRVWRHDQRNGAHGGERNRFPLFSMYEMTVACIAYLTRPRIPSLSIGRAGRAGPLQLAIHG